MERGLVVIGYQGIGKSTLAKKNLRCIDLESSAFYIDNKRIDNWEIPYVQMAVALAKEGRVVLLSSHKRVRRALEEAPVPVVACVPRPHLRDTWVSKLKRRWEQTREPKDFRAYMNAHDCYVTNVSEISEDVGDTIWIESMGYDLEQLIFDWLADN